MRMGEKTEQVVRACAVWTRNLCHILGQCHLSNQMQYAMTPQRHHIRQIRWGWFGHILGLF